MAYATDPAIFDDFEADLTSLLEVPDLDFPSSQDFPRATYRDSAFASTSAAAGKHLKRQDKTRTEKERKEQKRKEKKQKQKRKENFLGFRV